MGLSGAGLRCVMGNGECKNLIDTCRKVDKRCRGEERRIGEDVGLERRRKYIKKGMGRKNRCWE